MSKASRHRSSRLAELGHPTHRNACARRRPPQPPPPVPPPPFSARQSKTVGRAGTSTQRRQARGARSVTTRQSCLSRNKIFCSCSQCQRGSNAPGSAGSISVSSYLIFPLSLPTTLSHFPIISSYLFFGSGQAALVRSSLVRWERSVIPRSQVYQEQGHAVHLSDMCRLRFCTLTIEIGDCTVT